MKEEIQPYYGLANNCLCIDIDNVDDWYITCKALYQYSYIKRRVYRTKSGGLHVYFYDLKPTIPLRCIFGDDYRRINMDMLREMVKSKLCRNVLFKSSEIYEVGNYG